MRWTQNDTAPPLDVQLDDEDFDLTGKDAQIIVRKRGGSEPIVNAVATVVQATPPAQVQYQWQSGDLSDTGTYNVEVEVTWDAGASVRTFFGGSFEVREELGSAP